MAYRQRDLVLANHLQQVGIRFDDDWAAVLKLKLALQTPQQRVAWLIEELAHKKALGPDDYYTIQLAIDEGMTASRAAVTKLMEMDTRRDKYTEIGFRALFSILKGVGDKETEPTLLHFLHDQDKRMVYHAGIAFDNVKDGMKYQYRAGY